MKKYILAFALLLGVTSFCYIVEAQNINISINIGRQPAWGPVGYDYVGYYYFPDIDCYYDVNLGMFYYMNRGRWISARYLPYAYRHYDLYGLYKVVLNVRDPWRYHQTHYRDYARYRGHRNQIVIRDSRDMRYRDSRNNRVVWYSDNKKHSTNKRDYNYNNRDNRKPDNTNNKYTNRQSNNKNYGKSNDKTNGRSDRNKSNNYNSSDRTKKGNTNEKVVRPSTSSKSSGYRLASTTERSTGRGR